MNNDYDTIFFEVIDNTLLHLYLLIAENPRSTPRVKRNEIVVRYLKPLVKLKHYQDAKKHIKRLIAIGRDPSGNLEQKLLELRDMSIRYDKSQTDAKRLFDLLSILEHQHQLPARFFDTEMKYQPQPNIFYLLPEHVMNGFNDDNVQIAPISLFLQSDIVADLVDIIDATGLFNAELVQLNQQTQEGHIVLHPTK